MEFSGMFKKNFQETLLVLVNSVARGNYKTMINQGF